MSLSVRINRMARRRWLLNLVLIGVPLVVIGVWVWRSYAPRTCKVNMLVDLDPNRALVAERLKKEADRYGLKVELSTESYGALDAIALVDEPNPIDIALVPGGVAKREYANVRQVAALSPEPLQLLVRPGFAEEGVMGLKGRRICIGPPTASTHWIARDVLAFAGLHPSAPDHPGDYVAAEASPQQLREQLERLRDLAGARREEAVRKMPDAVFLLSTLPSILAHDLVGLAGYRLVALPFADAYCLDRIRQNENGGARVDRAIFSAMDIPPYTYSVEPAVPAKPCRTIATRLLLIAYSESDAEAVARLSETVFDGAIAGLVDPVPLKGHAPQFPLHPGTERYMRRSEPVLSPEMTAALGRAAGGLGALVSGIIALYSFLRLRQLRRFESYYKEIRRLELVARGQEQDPAAPPDPATRRAYLEERLLDLKSRALADFANGGLKGEGLMFGIVSLVNDTRASLARLTAHPENSALQVPATAPLTS
jgi:TRAP-type uncharacterized transport system substrate-binding protein